MKARFYNLGTSLFTVLACLWLVTACQRKCQQPATERFQTFTGQEWRLVETTDPSPEFKKLSKSTFLVFNFDPTYTGSVRKVLNNLQFDNPAKTFIYTVDPDNELMRIKYTDPPAEDTGEAPPISGDPSTLSDPRDVSEYSYRLGRELELNDSKKGFYYRFVPFQGIVNPDDKCEF